MSIRPEVVPYIIGAVVVGLLVMGVCLLKGIPLKKAVLAADGIALVLAAYFCYFFRDPQRTPPSDASVAVAGADGRIASITVLSPEQFRSVAAFCGMNEERIAKFLPGEVVRISIFLSLFDVHVNRAPIGGTSEFLGYFPGQHVFTFKDKSSDVNQHNSILIEGLRTVCLVNQIVGPVARRVVYWPSHDSKVMLKAGDRIGMMKFGSRLDMYFPVRDVEIRTKVGDRVTAGETVIAVTGKEVSL